MVATSQFCLAYVLVDLLCLVLTVIISSNVSRDSGSEVQVRYFFLLLTANLVFDIGDATWTILVYGGLFEPSELFLTVVNGVNLTAIAFAGYFWLGFTLAHFGSWVVNRKVLRVATAIPAFAVIVMHTIGYFTGQNVIYAPDGSVSYGVMHIAIAIVPLLYLLSATTVAVDKFLHAESRTQRRTSAVFMLFMLPPAAAAVFDIFVPSMPVAAAGMMIAIVFVMMALQESRISNDALTGLNNRRRAEAYLEDSMSHASMAHPLYLFIVDMDRFKSINDTYGHLEGDHALQLMADTLRSVCSQVDAFAARWGGDEFVVIDARDESGDPEAVAVLIRDTLARKAHDANVQYELACTVGYAVCDSSAESCDALVAGADKMLYERKRSRR